MHVSIGGRRVRRTSHHLDAETAVCDTPSMRPCRIDNQLPQPRLELTLTTEPMPVPDSTRERLLHRIGARLDVACYRAGDVQEAVELLAVDELDRFQARWLIASHALSSSTGRGFFRASSSRGRRHGGDAERNGGLEIRAGLPAGAVLALAVGESSSELEAAPVHPNDRS